MSRVAVVHIISGDLWAGPENQLVTLLSALRRDERYAVRVVALNDGVLVKRLRDLAVPVSVIAEAGRSFFALVRAVAAELGPLGEVVLHSHRYKENILASLIARRAKQVVLVQTVHGTTEIFSGLKAFKARTYLGLNRLATKRAFDCVITVSEEIRSAVQRELGASPRIVTIRNAVQLETLRATRSSEEFRRSLAIPADALVLGMIGRLVPIKAVGTMLAAMPELLRRFPTAVLLLAGVGPEAGSLRAESSRLGIAAKVHFLGSRDDIPDLLQALDLLVISSLHEGIPTVLLEAMAMGRPVVSTAVGGIPEVVSDGVQGLLVPPGDSEALITACGRLLESPAERERLGRAGRARVEADFSAEVLGRRVGDLYAELLRISER